MRAPNLIHGLTLDVGYDGDTESSESLTDWLRAVLLPVVDSVLSAQDRKGQVCRIERLEIDLGTISRDDAEDTLASLLAAQLADALRWQIGQLPMAAQMDGTAPSLAPDAADAADGEDAGDQLMQFLRSGRLPWAIAADPQTAHEQLLRQVLAMPSAARVLQAVTQDPQMRVRLVRQYNAAMLQEVAAVLYPHGPSPQVQGEAPETFWLAALQGQAPGAPAQPPQPSDSALCQFRDWKQRKQDLPEQGLSLAELQQWLIWWLMHDSARVNQDCSLMLESIKQQCAQMQEPERFMRLVLAALRDDVALDLEALALQASQPVPQQQPVAAMDAITSLQSHQAIRNFIAQQALEQQELGNLNSAQLHQLVRGWIGGTPSVFLTAIENHALQATDAHTYFRRVLHQLLDGQAIDLEDLTAPASDMSAKLPAAMPATAASPAITLPAATQAVVAAATATAPAAALAQASAPGTPPSQHARAAGEPSPLPALMQQSLPQRLANALLQADLGALEIYWPEITRHHADVLTAAVQRYLRRPQERAQLIARSSPDMLIAMLKAITPKTGQVAEIVLRHAEACNAVLPHPLPLNEFHQRVLNFSLEQALYGGQGGTIFGVIEAVEDAADMVEQVAHAWRVILPSMRELEQKLFGNRYLQVLQAEDDDIAPSLQAMLADEIRTHYPELLDQQYESSTPSVDSAAGARPQNIALNTLNEVDDSGAVIRSAPTPQTDAVTRGAPEEHISASTQRAERTSALVGSKAFLAVEQSSVMAGSEVAREANHVLSVNSREAAQAAQEAVTTSVVGAHEAARITKRKLGGILPADVVLPADPDGISQQNINHSTLSEVNDSGVAIRSGSAKQTGAATRGAPGEHIDVVMQRAAGDHEAAPVAGLTSAVVDGAAAQEVVPTSVVGAREAAWVARRKSGGSLSADVVVSADSTGVRAGEITARTETEANALDTAGTNGVSQQNIVLDTSSEVNDTGTVTRGAPGEHIGVVTQQEGRTSAAVGSMAAPAEQTSVVAGSETEREAKGALSVDSSDAPQAAEGAIAGDREVALVAGVVPAAPGGDDGLAVQAGVWPVVGVGGAPTAASYHAKPAAEAEAMLAVLLMRAEPLGQVEHLAAELLLQRLLRAASSASVATATLNGALETALSQPSAIERLTGLAPAPILAELLVRLQPALAAQLPAILRAVAGKASVNHVPAMQTRSTWRSIYQAAFVAADPVTPAEFIRTLTRELGGSDLTPPAPAAAAAAATPQDIMKRLLQPITAQPAGQHEHAQEAEAETTDESNIRNAGMVIIATYAQRLFSILDLTKDGQFISEEAAQRGVHLLQYAITGASATPEYQLTLNKLLCGIHGGKPITCGIDITDKEKDTIEQMLNGVIAHWKALGKTSIAGLRQTFLQREGQLHFEEEAWHLHIPSATFDMLLDRLPWSFAMIRFPWMEHPLKVTWR
jgi:hypothetical protein